MTIFDTMSKIYFSVTVNKKNKLVMGVLNFVLRIQHLDTFHRVFLCPYVGQISQGSSSVVGCRLIHNVKYILIKTVVGNAGTWCHLLAGRI